MGRKRLQQSKEKKSKRKKQKNIPRRKKEAAEKQGREERGRLSRLVASYLLPIPGFIPAFHHYYSSEYISNTFLVIMKAQSTTIGGQKRPFYPIASCTSSFFPRSERTGSVVNKKSPTSSSLLNNSTKKSDELLKAFYMKRSISS